VLRVQVVGRENRKVKDPAVKEKPLCCTRAQVLPLFRVCRPKLCRRWHANHGESPMEDSVYWITAYGGAWTADLHGEPDWEVVDIYNRRLSRAVGSKASQERLWSCQSPRLVSGALSLWWGDCMQRRLTDSARLQTV
jgi:hypothetical protein